MKEKISFFLRNKTKIQSGNEVIFGKKNRIRACKIIIQGKNNRLIFEDGANLRGVQIEILGNGCTIKIGKNSVIGEGCFFSAREQGTELIIGEQCMFSRNVKIMTSDGHDILDIESKKRINTAKSVYIGDRVWLADGAVVLKGCRIGSHAMLGLNAVLTQELPNNAIAAGNPAKIIKQNILWQEELSY